MIHAVRANKPSFNAVEFTEGFNVVLADRTQESDKKGPRNGLGKTTLVEIIHFCLGANASLNKGLKALSGWSFSLELSLGQSRFIVHRSVDKSQKIEIEGDIDDLKIDTLTGERRRSHPRPAFSTSVCSTRTHSRMPISRRTSISRRSYDSD